MLISFQVIHFGEWDIVRLHSLKVPALKWTRYSNVGCPQKQGREKTAPRQDKWLMTG